MRLSIGRIENARYARNVKIRSRNNGSSDQTIGCSTVDEFVRLTLDLRGRQHRAWAYLAHERSVHDRRSIQKRLSRRSVRDRRGGGRCLPAPWSRLSGRSPFSHAVHRQAGPFPSHIEFRTLSTAPDPTRRNGMARRSPSRKSRILNRLRRASPATPSSSRRSRSAAASAARCASIAASSTPAP
jgi:hypothetical protein